MDRNTHLCLSLLSPVVNIIVVVIPRAVYVHTYVHVVRAAIALSRFGTESRRRRTCDRFPKPIAVNWPRRSIPLETERATCRSRITPVTASRITIAIRRIGARTPAASRTYRRGMRRASRSRRASIRERRTPLEFPLERSMNSYSRYRSRVMIYRY